MMDYVLSLSDIDRFKSLLAVELPTAKASDRVEAMARGLGYSTYASLRADLKSEVKLVQVHEQAFAQYLATRDVAAVRPGLLDRLLTELDEVREQEEITGVVRGEMLSSMPGTFEEFLEDMEAPGGAPDVTNWAEALGATRRCTMGFEIVIQPDRFIEEVIRYYNVEDNAADRAHERIESALLASGNECGEGGEGGDLCSYHAHQASKDD